MAEGAVEEKTYRAFVRFAGKRASFRMRVSRGPRGLDFSIVEVEGGGNPASVASVVEALLFREKGRRSSWLYDRRRRGKRVVEKSHAGPLRVTTEAIYDREGWLLRARITAPGLEAVIEQEGAGAGG